MTMRNITKNGDIDYHDDSDFSRNNGIAGGICIHIFIYISLCTYTNIPIYSLTYSYILIILSH